MTTCANIRSRTTRRVISAVLCCMVLSGSSLAVTLDAYKNRCDSALAFAFQIETALQKSKPDDFLEEELITYVDENFPVSERVDWYGGSVDVSNEWLRQKTTKFGEQEDVAARTAAIAEIREYLSTLTFKLRELDRQVAGRTKDEDKQKLAEILSREEYQKPQAAEESIFSRWFREFLEWLESLFPKPNLPTGSTSGMEGLALILQILFYVALAGLLVFLIYRLAPLLIPKLRRRQTPKKTRRIILGEHIADDENADDLFLQAELLAREGNMRGAIRKGYIALLCDLADRKVIGLARNKTNRDYLRDVRTRRELHPRMRAATETFERHWYGSHDSHEQDWIKFRDEYREALRSV